MKHIQDISGAQNLKTLRGERKGSIPKQKRSQFLELYVHEQERERLLQEIKILERKILLNRKKLEKTVENINAIRKTVNQEESQEQDPNLKVVPFNGSPQEILQKNNTKKRRAR